MIKIMLSVDAFCPLRCNEEGPLKVFKWSDEDSFHFSPQYTKRCLILCAWAGILNKAKEAYALSPLSGFHLFFHLHFLMW